ncbi:MAG: dihydropteroate synthase [Candidatus Omnitrophota bacterium]
MMPYVLALKNSRDLVREFGEIGVDWAGMSIMRPKGVFRVVKLRGLPSFLANILKQEMLSLGGDAAVSRGSLTGRGKKTDCLVMGTLAQFKGLIDKLKRQSFGLEPLGGQIKSVLDRFDGHGTVLDLGKKFLRFGKKTFVMGIVNATPDSFSGDGLLGRTLQEAFDVAQKMVALGADIIDVGGESSRPGSRRISAKEEIARVVPLLKRLSKKLRVPISIDTVKSEVAKAALDAGASIVNDISALRFDKKMASLIGRRKAAVVLMHMKGRPATMQKKPRYAHLMTELIDFFEAAVARAEDAGIAREKIILDPGIGFGKSVEHNVEILRRLSELKCFGRPLLVGLSRKWFIGQILALEAQERMFGTAAALGVAIAHGADVVRVHDVGEMKQVVRLTDALVRN